MNTKKLDTTLTNINKLGFDNIWSGSSYEIQSISLNNLLVNLQKAIGQLDKFNIVLEKKERYINICTTLSNLYKYKDYCESNHTEKQLKEGCGLCQQYSTSIRINEENRLTLRNEIIGLLSQFESITAEISGPSDLSDYPGKLNVEDINEISNKNIGEYPLYNQNDYSDVPYGKGTVATSGCGITCAAMLITSYAGQEVTPDIIAKELKWTGNDKTMEAALDSYGINYANNWRADGKFDEGVNIYYFHDVKEKLKQGYTAIILMKKGNFTNKEHFVLATGINDDGKIMINDPNGNNYTKGNQVLDDGYQNGFDDSVFLNEWSGCWLIEPIDTYRERTDKEK